MCLGPSECGSGYKCRGVFLRRQCTACMHKNKGMNACLTSDQGGMILLSAFVTTVLDCSSQTWDKGFRAPWTMCCTPPTPWCQQLHWSCQMNLTSRTRATPKQGCQMRHGPLTTSLCWQSSNTNRLELGQLLWLRLKQAHTCWCEQCADVNSVSSE